MNITSKLIWRWFDSDEMRSAGYQNDTLMTNLRSKSKLKVEFQYGDRPFSEDGSNFISVVDWDISSKFGSLINFHLFKRVQTLNMNPEVYLRRNGRHLEKSIRRYNSAADRPITTKFDRQMQNEIPMTTYRSKSKAEVELQYGVRPFSETESCFSSVVEWDIEIW